MDLKTRYHFRVTCWLFCALSTSHLEQPVSQGKPYTSQLATYYTCLLSRSHPGCLKQSNEVGEAPSHFTHRTEAHPRAAPWGFLSLSGSPYKVRSQHRQEDLQLQHCALIARVLVAVFWGAAGHTSVGGGALCQTQLIPDRSTMDRSCFKPMSLQWPVAWTITTGRPGLLSRAGESDKQPLLE